MAAVYSSETLTHVSQSITCLRSHLHEIHKFHMFSVLIYAFCFSLLTKTVSIFRHQYVFAESSKQSYLWKKYQNCFVFTLNLEESQKSYKFQLLSRMPPTSLPLKQHLPASNILSTQREVLVLHRCNT